MGKVRNAAAVRLGALALALVYAGGGILSIYHFAAVYHFRDPDSNKLFELHQGCHHHHDHSASGTLFYVLADGADAELNSPSRGCEQYAESCPFELALSLSQAPLAGAPDGSRLLQLETLDSPYRVSQALRSLPPLVKAPKRSPPQSLT